MSLHTKTNPVGIDKAIQPLQQRLYEKLIAKWGDKIVYECYGRCYRNKKGNGYVAEVYDTINDYKDVYWDDSLDAISFFGISPVQSLDFDYKAQIHLVFFVNLSTLKPDIKNDRADENVRLDVLDIIRKNIGGNIPISYSTGIENVLKEYRGSYTDNSLKNIDMHPVHCFRFDFDLRFNPLRKC